VTALRCQILLQLTVGPPSPGSFPDFSRVSSIAGKIVDYGSEGWLWALFGLCQRMYVDSRSATDVNGPARARIARARDERRTRA